MSKNTNIIHSLTSLRKFAALGVFLSHLGIMSQSSIPQFNEASRYFFSGYVGVTFFYILSGFIINYSFSRHLAEGRFSNKDFIVYRLARLFPVHIVSLLCVLILFGYTKNWEATNKEALLYNTFLLQSFIPDAGYYFSFNPVSWSISCEMFFYLCFCLLVKCRTKHLFFAFSAVQAINIYFLVYPPSGVSLHWLFYINPIFRISDFMLGIIICRAFLAKPVTPKIVVCSAMEIGSLLFLALTIYVATNYVANMNVKYDLLYIPCMASVVIAFAFNGGIISRILANKYLILLGEASFSFYMFHWMIVSKLIEIMKPDKNDYASVLIYAASCLALSIAVSIISFKVIEMPANKIIRNAWGLFKARAFNDKALNKT
ncbi:acyltransferase [Cronobacter sakazakii]|uniref:acyltransferase family protein n=1 Tax=Cronobacter sakazakii TaxID=28141 RepID=UPI00294AE42E|nr:acyltransferase [Cronobacter sakazakii]MDI7549260.1 acyltransferase [Cronobacter sakazakii]MDI7611628.1 acyltransferase [Cronobacter sakazakii]MDI7615196.1 acyltransferase [Cronobacter sakazakii]MDK1124396.1 acyltransferase [Cronobacter sakazakii]MDK1268816.1 acyltransferase [Cronobacter sakazakii]